MTTVWPCHCEEPKATKQSRPRSPRRQELRGIDRRRAFADLEMKLRLAALAAPTRLGDHLTAPDMVAELDGRLVGAAIGRDEVMAAGRPNPIAPPARPPPQHHASLPPPPGRPAPPR